MRRKQLLEMILSVGSLPQNLKNKLKKYKQKNPNKKISFVVVSKKKDKILGYNSSIGEAKSRLRVIEFYKHH